MARRLGLTPYFVALGACLAFAVGCSGADGEDGAQGAKGDTGDQGPAGDPGDPGTPGQDGQDAVSSPSISAVVPNAAFVDRTKTVTISGFGTEWDAASAPTVSFGDNITVDSVTVASPTALVATISIDADATLGARDVSVTAGADTLTYTTAFMIESPLNLELTGTSAQGSVMLADAMNRDFEAPFDTTYTGDGFFTPIEYTNIQVSALAGIMGDISSVEPYTVSMVLYVDVDAAAGSKDFDILSGPSGAQKHFPYPGAFNVEARTAEALTTSVTGTVSDVLASSLYVYEGSTSSAQFVSFAASSAEANTDPAFFLLPSSGHFADAISYDAAAKMITDPAGSTFYLVYLDGTGASGYDFTIESTAMDVTLGTDTEPNDDISQAIEATAMPFAMADASIPSETDEDWIKYEATAADVGKAFHIVTMPGQAYTDTVVAAYESDGTTLLGDESENMNYHEDHMSAQIPAAGTYYIRVSADQTGYYDSSNSVYSLLITLE